MSKNTFRQIQGYIKKNAVRKISSVLASGFDLGRVDDNGRTLLIHAAALGRLEVIKVIVEVYKDREMLGYLDMQDNEGNTALMHAAMNGRGDTVRLLLELHPDMLRENREGATASDLAKDGRIRKDIAGCLSRELEHAVFEKDIERVKKIAETGFDPKNEWAEKALDLTINSYHSFEKKGEMLKILLDGGINPNAVNDSKKPFFQQVVEHEPVEAVEAFLEHGADADAHTDIRTETPIQIAARVGRNDIARILLRAGANIQSEDTLNKSAMAWAIHRNDLELLNIAIEAGYPLDKRFGAVYDQKTGSGAIGAENTALGWAVFCARLELIKALLNAGADPNSICNNKGRSPLGIAFDKLDTTMVEFLMENGAVLSNEAYRALGLALSTSATFGKNDEKKSLERFLCAHEIKDVKYAEESCPKKEYLLCSDNQCSCKEKPIPRGEGYLYVSPEYVDYRKDCLTLSEKAGKNKELDDEFRSRGIVFFGSGTLIPVFMCEEAVRKRGLDKYIAHADAVYWQNTSRVPLRETPHAQK